MIQRAQANFKINNLNWKADALDWIGDCIEEIGYHTGFEPKFVKLKVKNYRVKVPYFVISLEGVKYNGTRLALVKTREDAGDSNLLTYSEYNLASDDIVVDLNKEYKRLEELQGMYALSNTQDILDAIIEAQNKISLLVKNVIFYGRSAHLRCAWYRVEAGHIHTSFPDGEVTLDANCFMVDEQGYPVTVNTLKYRNAVIWSIMYHLLLQGNEHPTVSLEYAEHQKDSWIAQATNEPHIMSNDRMDNFSNRWDSIKRDADLITLIGN